ncbi:mutS protein homolog 5-like [Anticarsia gemmatalis]|uniref:mutS protein homolog 5-like n=1 Tax=Anticarsia gemmatalis TaxID=129554 RepID=UPI003F76FCAA
METTSSDGPSTSAQRQPSGSDLNSNQTDNHFVIAKCRRNTDVTVNPNNNDQQETSEESETEERVLVVYCRAGRLGAAYCTLQSGELFILEEIVDRPPGYQIFASLFRQVEPVCILLEGKNQGGFVQTVKKTVFDTDANDDARCKLVFLSSKEYSFEACKRRIASLSLPSEPPNCSKEERSLFLRTVLDFSQTQSIHALGALLRYLDLNWAKLSMELHGKPSFISLRIISLADIVSVDEDTYRGLQVFSALAHPSAFKRGARGSSREGLSLYQLFSKCSSKLGQTYMRVLLQHPTCDVETLKRRQDVVAFFTRPQNEALMRNICSSLRFIKNVHGILTKIKALSAKAYQWKSLYNTLYNAVLICEMCESAGKHSEFLNNLACFDNNKLYEMALYMNRIIDFDLSKTEGKFTVKAGVDPELDMKKQTMASLQGLMSETAKVELERLPSYVQECSMLYMPHLGYLLGVKVWADNLTAEEKQLPDMKFLFQNNDNIHYKSKGCEELDVVIGDTYPEIVSHETRIMMRLTAHMLQHLQTLATVVNTCAELDCLIAISKVCKEFNYVRPTLTLDKVISIRQGKHPLYMMTCDNFVPNDVESSQDAGCVKILIGPNSSGKSVYMKQIGLIVYLAHVGSFVPAESATIGIVRHIHTRIQSTECVAAHMSAFLIDLRQMALALQESTSNSLLLIDEFGKGTSATDGMCLLAACLNTLLFRDNCPHVVVATHYLNIKEYVVNSPMLRYLHFEYVIEEGEPVFLFRVSEGAATSSYALQVAAATGLKTTTVSRANEVLNAVMNNTLPPANKRITSKQNACIEAIKTKLLTDDI